MSQVDKNKYFVHQCIYTYFLLTSKYFHIMNKAVLVASQLIFLAVYYNVIG